MTRALVPCILISKITMPQATITTAVYDSKRRVLIPKETPLFTDIKEVMVVFVPKKTHKKEEILWGRIMELLEENWEYNCKKNVTEDEVMKIALQAQQTARKHKRLDR